MNIVWTDIYYIALRDNLGRRYGIYYVENDRSVNFTWYGYEWIAKREAKRLFKCEMAKVEKLLTSSPDLGSGTTS